MDETCFCGPLFGGGVDNSFTRLDNLIDESEIQKQITYFTTIRVNIDGMKIVLMITFQKWGGCKR